MKDNRDSSVYSELKIFYHSEKVGDILAEKRTAPIYVRIKPTNTCNQNCYYCSSKDDNIPEERKLDYYASIPWEKLQEIIQDLSDMGVKAVTFSGGGEPLIYPHIEDALSLVKEKHIDYSMISNGQALEGEKAKLLADAKWLRISLESACAETYEKIRGVHTFDKVIDNIKNFVQIKSPNCTVGINCVVTRDNYEEIYDLCRIASEIGVNNIKLSPMRLDGSLSQYHNTIEEEVQKQILCAKQDFENQQFTIIDKYDGDSSLNEGYEKPYCHCMIQEVFTVIGADCKVYLCHQRAYTKDGDIADLTKQSFKEAWYSEETIRKVRELDVRKACNFRCVFDERNELLNHLASIDKNHINFI